jgi:acyl carrier protein
MNDTEYGATDYAAELRTLIATVLELPANEVTDSSRLIEDLDVDSLASLQIAVQVEKRFGVSIGETHLASISTVGDIRDLVESRMVERSGG